MVFVSLQCPKRVIVRRYILRRGYIVGDFFFRKPRHIHYYRLFWILRDIGGLNYLAF